MSYADELKKKYSTQSVPQVKNTPDVNFANQLKQKYGGNTISRQSEVSIPEAKLSLNSPEKYQIENGLNALGQNLKDYETYGLGNINLKERPIVKNADGSYSTVRSMSFNDNGKEILVPTVINGKVVSDDEAIEHYYQTGEYLGKFNTIEEANKYAEDLHLKQEKMYREKIEQHTAQTNPKAEISLNLPEKYQNLPRTPQELNINSMPNAQISNVKPNNVITQSLASAGAGIASTSAEILEYYKDHNQFQAGGDAQKGLSNMVKETMKYSTPKERLQALKDKSIGEYIEEAQEEGKKERYEDIPKIIENLRELRERTQERNSQLGGIGQKIANSSMVVGDMVPAIVAGSAGGPVASSAMIYGNSAQNAYSEAVNNGATHNEAGKNAILSGALETGVEALSGGAFNKLAKLPGVSNVSKLTRNINNKFVRGALNIAGDVIGEGLEEVVSTELQPFIDQITYNPNAPLATFQDDWNSFSESILPTLMFAGIGGISNQVNRIADKQKSSIENTNISNEKKIQQKNQVEQMKNKVLAYAEKELSNTTQENVLSEQKDEISNDGDNKKESQRKMATIAQCR